MNRSMLTMKIMLFLTIAALAAVLTNQAVAVPKNPGLIAVLDVQEAFDKLEEKMIIERDRETAVRRAQQEAEGRVEEIKALEGELEMLASLPDSDANKQSKQNDLMQKMAYHRSMMEIEQMRINREVGLRLEGVRRKMLDTIEAVCKSSNVDIVLNKDTTIQIPQGNRNVPNNITTVLWHSEQVDITQDVIVRMNNQFKNN